MEKKLYIATAIPYVNGSPHVGHAMDYLLADIWARYQKQNGHDVRFQVGTDEHGSKIAAKAADAGLDPKAYVDKIYLDFEILIKKLGASYTDFIRTTDERHVKSVQYIWQQLKPYIYKSKYEGWYCVGCECFVTDKEANENNGVCPDHNQPYQKLSEENYYLKASAFTAQIKQALESNALEVVPEFRKKEFLEMIKDGLQDVSISRPKKSLGWGIAVPDDPDQVMYVWMDALSNYITVLGYPDDPTWKEYWPADLQVLGKDILRFHLGIWPVILLGLGLQLPKRMLVHGFVNIDGAKQSKSLGNGVNPIDMIDQYGVDAVRYFFSKHIPTLSDGDFTWEKFETAYNTELANDLGNLVQRVAGMITRYQSGVIGQVADVDHDTGAYVEAMDRLEFNKAMEEIWSMVRNANQYIENVKPWEIAKNIGTDADAASHLSEVLSYSAGALLQISELLVPFLPGTAEKIKNIFGTGVIIPSESVIFPKIYIHTADPRAPKA
jgi:methionyl-tRNA synthetase